MPHPEQSMHRPLLMSSLKARPAIYASDIDSTGRLDEVEEGDSQNSYRDSISSGLDFDPDETMASQQTVDTELTQSSPSMISRVGVSKFAIFRLS